MLHFEDDKNQYSEDSFGAYIYGDAAKLHVERLMERQGIDYFIISAECEEPYYEKCDIQHMYSSCMKLIAMHKDGDTSEWDICWSIGCAMINYDWDNHVKIQVD